MGDSSQFVTVRINTLRADVSLGFDLFVKVNEKFIHYIKKEDAMEQSAIERIQRLEKLCNKNVDRLYIRVEDEDAYDDFIDATLEELSNNAVNYDEGEQVKIIEDLALNAVEVVFDEPESQQAFKLAEKSAKGLRKVVQDNPKSLAKFYKKTGVDTNIIQEHSKNVSAVALRLGFAMGLRGEDLDVIGNAALLHDIGLTKLDKDQMLILFKRPTSKLSPGDQRVYQMHVEDGVKMLKGKKSVSAPVIQLVEAHEEVKSGKGYPNKLESLTLQQEVLAISNKFEKKITAYGMNPVEAYKQLEFEEMGNFDLKLIKKLKSVLKAGDVFSLDGGEAKDEDGD